MQLTPSRTAFTFYYDCHSPRYSLPAAAGNRDVNGILRARARGVVPARRIAILRVQRALL